MGGLDTFASISDYLFASLSNAEESLPVLKNLVEKGNYGTKTGSGFYDWSPSFSRKMNRRRENELIRYLELDSKSDKEIKIIK
jgi:3-hydroxybutyryl-CoA dehydrogenase